VEEPLAGGGSWGLCDINEEVFLALVAIDGLE